MISLTIAFGILLIIESLFMFLLGIWGIIEYENGIALLFLIMSIITFISAILLIRI